MATALLASTCLASDYPSRPITLVIAFPPGGGADAVARPIADALGKELGQPVVIDNRPGAGMTMASRHVAKSAPDGYTLYMTSASHYGADKVLYKNLPYDGKSFTPIAKWTTTPLVLAVSHQSGIQSVSDLITRAKAQPGKLTYASSGSGVAPHLAATLFEQATGTHMTHVPFKGGAPAVNAVAAGDVDLTFGTPPSIAPLAQSGKVKMLAVTSLERSKALKDLPSLNESGVKGFDYTFWFGLYGPAKLPDDVVNKLAKASAKVLAMPDIQQRVIASGNATSPSTSAGEFGAWAQKEGARLKVLMEKSGASVD